MEIFFRAIGIGIALAIVIMSIPVGFALADLIKSKEKK